MAIFGSLSDISGITIKYNPMTVEEFAVASKVLCTQHMHVYRSIFSFNYPNDKNKIKLIVMIFNILKEN